VRGKSRHQRLMALGDGKPRLAFSPSDRHGLGSHLSEKENGKNLAGGGGNPIRALTGKQRKTKKATMKSTWEGERTLPLEYREIEATVEGGGTGVAGHLQAGDFYSLVPTRTQHFEGANLTHPERCSSSLKRETGTWARGRKGEGPRAAGSPEM